MNFSRICWPHEMIPASDELQILLKEVIEERIPFNRVLGLSVESFEMDQIQIRIGMRPELVGNFLRGNLHGGVISSILDVVGGMVAWLGVMKKMKDCTLEEMTDRFSRVGTIDLRVDYLRPGLGDFFIGTGSIIRAGNKVTVVRMELHNNEEQMIAVGTGTYTVG